MAKSSSRSPQQKPFNSPTRPAASGQRSRGLSLLLGAVIFLALVVAGLVAVNALSQNESESSGGGTNATSTLPPTDVPPTEAPQEVALQQQVRDWVQAVEGVTQVLTLDIDVPGDEPPLIYAELEVEPGFNTTSVPNQLVAKVSEILGASQYSDVVVIMNDGTLVTEYTLNLESGGWNETILTSSAPSSTPSN